MPQKIWISQQIFQICTHNGNIYKYISSWFVSFTSIQYCRYYPNYKIYCHLMITDRNLPFCAADSNKYIGFTHPHLVCSSCLFPHSHLISEFPFQQKVTFFQDISFSSISIITLSLLELLDFCSASGESFPSECQNIYVVNYIGR